MSRLATTRLSSKGQVVIPEAIRKALGLRPGTEFVVVGKGDAVVLKTITPPDPDEFDEIIAETRRQAREAGLTPEAARAIVDEVRRGV
ncbi:AbrB/MazE/SpoVT family DNA-binding domain-containing protein [Deferrisoma camini]|uniref:AbrB/MazE/SpoVT family DNA-binding domain-containing protein n=1 Tax=Deferrisoma camini TaxID=1035120 RepID=UPI0004B7C13E|nr:AbrB/MazE/SpoVT family DNA-binding domain-containing protein [Deferrisoma camini]